MSRPQLKLVETSAREPGTDVPSDDFCSPRVYELPVMLSQGRCIQLGFIRRAAGRWEIDERPETQRTRFAGCTERELAPSHCGWLKPCSAVIMARWTNICRKWNGHRRGTA